MEPQTYLRMVRSEIPAYDRLQDVLVQATSGVPARRILDLGSGTGVTAQHVLARHPDASLIGIDASDHMLTHARTAVPEASFRVARLEDPLPPGPFDLVVSAFAVHHLEAGQKAALFGRVASVLATGGRFLLADVVVPSRPVDRPVPLEPGIDRPSSVRDHLDWLADAGLRPEVIVEEGDLAVIRADAVRVSGG